MGDRIGFLRRSNRDGLLAERRYSYGAVGSTHPEASLWTSAPPGFRRYERRVRVGAGAACWAEATESMLTWGIKRRSGFSVEPVGAAGLRVVESADFWLVAEIGPVRVREPARVVTVVDQPARCGFAYGTLEGHPVSGEEAFTLHRDGDEVVWLTLRSLTRSGRGRWRLAYPFVLLAQRAYRRRYARALVEIG